jgi:hypothetical protein
MLRVILTALVCTVALFPAYAAEPGPALFDELTPLVLQQIDAVAADPQAADRSALRRALEPLANRHAADPRYWQAVLAATDRGAPSWDPVYPELLARGAADPASYFLLDQRFGSDGVTEQTVIDQLDAAIAADPANSWYYYVKADFLLSLGEPEQCLALVRQGNAAPRNYIPCFYLAAEAQRRLGRATQPAEQVAVAFWLWNDQTLPNLVQIGEAFRAVEVCCALGFTPDLADAYLLRAQRLGEAENGIFVYTRRAQGLARALLEFMHDNVLVLDAGQAAEYAALQSALAGIDTLGAELDRRSQSRGLLTPEYQPAIATVWPFYAVDRTQYLRMYEQALDERQLVQQAQLYFKQLSPPPFAAWAAGRSRFDQP